MQCIINQKWRILRSRWSELSSISLLCDQLSPHTCWSLCYISNIIYKSKSFKLFPPAMPIPSFWRLFRMNGCKISVHDKLGVFWMMLVQLFKQALNYWNMYACVFHWINWRWHRPSWKISSCKCLNSVFLCSRLVCLFVHLPFSLKLNDRSCFS